MSKGTTVRLMIVRDWPGRETLEGRGFSLWTKDPNTREFIQTGQWEQLPEGVFFEPGFPNYVTDSTYASNDPATIHVAVPKSTSINLDGQEVVVTNLDFSSGGRLKGCDNIAERCYSLVLAQGHIDDGVIHYTAAGNISSVVVSEKKDSAAVAGAVMNPDNWAQININVVSGFTEVLRP